MDTKAMPSLSDVISWANLEIWLLILTLCSQLKQSCALDSNSTYPPYRILPNGHEHGSRENIAISKNNILQVSPDHSHAHKLIQKPRPIDIYWLNSSTDSISIRWALTGKTSLSGYIRESVVEYLSEGGRFTSLPLNPIVNEYTFRNLDVDTIYTICVYMIEVYGAENSSSITHSKCVKINTIEYIRRDSVLWMMLTIGYYIFMGVLGYTQWKRKCWAIEKRNRAKDLECDKKSDKYAMRWKDLEQKEKLMTRPGCSIETNDT